MPKTLTQIKEEDAAVREQAREFEDLLTRRGNYERAIARLEPQVDKYAKQVEVVAKIEAAVADLDATIDVGGGFGLVKRQIEGLVGRARTDQERRLLEARNAVDRCRLELKQTVAALKKFED